MITPVLQPESLNIPFRATPYTYTLFVSITPQTGPTPSPPLHSPALDTSLVPAQMVIGLRSYTIHPLSETIRTS